MSTNGNGKANGRNGNGKASRIRWFIDPDIRRIIRRALKAAATIPEAARAAGISPRTLNTWKDDHAEIAESLSLARASGRAQRLRIIQAHARKDWRAASWLLSIENPERYGKRERVEHSGALTLTDAISKTRDAVTGRR